MNYDLTAKAAFRGPTYRYHSAPPEEITFLLGELKLPSRLKASGFDPNRSITVPCSELFASPSPSIPLARLLELAPQDISPDLLDGGTVNVSPSMLALRYQFTITKELIEEPTPFAPPVIEPIVEAPAAPIHFDAPAPVEAQVPVQAPIPTAAPMRLVPPAPMAPPPPAFVQPTFAETRPAWPPAEYSPEPVMPTHAQEPAAQPIEEIPIAQEVSAAELPAEPPQPEPASPKIATSSIPTQRKVFRMMPILRRKGINPDSTGTPFVPPAPMAPVIPPPPQQPPQQPPQANPYQVPFRDSQEVPQSVPEDVSPVDEIPAPLSVVEPEIPVEPPVQMPEPPEPVEAFAEIPEPPSQEFLPQEFAPQEMETPALSVEPHQAFENFVEPQPLTARTEGLPAQGRLQEIFMTEEHLSAERVLELCGGLPGIRSCILAKGSNVLASHNVPSGIDLVSLTANASAMLSAIRTSSMRMGLGAIPAVTVHSEKGPVSFFHADDLAMLVLHSDRGFVPGVRERLHDVVIALGESNLALPIEDAAG